MDEASWFCCASWSADGLPLAGGSLFRCAGTGVPECAATGDMRLTLSLGVEHAGRAEGGIGLVGVGGPEIACAGTGTGFAGRTVASRAVRLGVDG